MSQAGGELQHLDPSRAPTRRPEGHGAGAWADLRPAARWIQRRRPVLVGAILLIAAQIAWRAEFLSRMYFYRQDFFNLDFALTSPFNWHYLSYVGTGHLMIGERAIIWVLARISLYNWTLASAVSLAFLAAAGLAAFIALRTLFGERPAILALLAVYLLAPAGVPDLGWWTIALESVPLQLAMFMALNSHIHYVRTGRLRHLAAASIWVIFGLLAFEKGLIVPVLLFAVTSAFLAGGGSWLSGMRRVLRRHWRAWLCYTAALVGYAIVLVTSLSTSSTQPLMATSSAVFSFSWRLLRDSLIPAAVGGPWRWWQLPGQAYALGLPPPVLAWLALVVVAAVAGGSIVLRRVSWRAWATLAAWVVLADMLPVIIGRLNWYPQLLALDTHYVADAMAVLVICIGLAFLPVIDGSVAKAARATALEGPTRLRARTERPRAEQMRRFVVAGLLVEFVIGALWSTSAYQSNVTGQPAAMYIANSSLAIDLAPKGTLVLDAPVPDQVRDSTNGARVVIGDIHPGKLTWIERPHGTVDGLRMFGPDGRLYPMWIYGATSGRGPVRGCWPQKRHRISVKFLNQPPYLTTLLRIGYIGGSSLPGVVEVRYGGTVQRLAVRSGLHSAYLPVVGTASGIYVTVLGNTKVCIGDAEAGNPKPVLSGAALPMNRQ